MDERQLQAAVSLSIGAGLGALTLRNRLRSIQEFDLGDAGESIQSGLKSAFKLGKRIVGHESFGEKMGRLAKGAGKSVVKAAEENPLIAAGIGAASIPAWRKVKDTARGLKERGQQLVGAITPGQ